MAVRAHTLIGVVTCEAHRNFAAAARDTWTQDVPPGFDVVFADANFMPGIPVRVPDTYLNLPYKTQYLCGYALFGKYKFLIKIDVDTYCRAALLARPKEDYGPQDYAGRVRGPSGGYPADFCSGGAYVLSALAMRAIVKAEVNDTAEDRWVGNVLLAAGIRPKSLPGWIAPTRSPITHYLRDDPNCVMLMQMESPEQMRRVYAGVYEPQTLPAGSQPGHFPEGSQLRAQMRKT